MIMLMVIAFTSAYAQEYKMENGKVIPVTKQVKVKKTDKVYQVIGKDTIFQGSKSGLYYWKMSKSGKRIKTYLKR